ncbi:MAG: hypothetical protein ACRDHZ_11390 [Ktedonobacteraceae bacterium]
MATNIQSVNPSSPEMLHTPQEKGSNLLQHWNTLTAIPNPPPTANFAEREAARKSQMTSNVLFFFTFMVIFLLPACYISPYPSYVWLDLGLLAACIIALVLNRQGHTLAAGILINTIGFLALTAALFSTIPFDETTLQGYDMYVIVELLAVSLLPIRSVFIVFICSIICIITTLLYMPHTAILDKDLHERLLIIVARPIGTLLLVAGVSFILSSVMINAIKRAGQAEMIAKLEHDMAAQKHGLEEGVQQILQTHVAISNGHLQARAPLSQNNVLWQISSALNNLLVRYQRAARAEQELQRVEKAVIYYVNCIQIAEKRQQNPILPLAQTSIDPLIVALQNQTVGQAQLSWEQHWMHSTVTPFLTKE